MKKVSIVFLVFFLSSVSYSASWDVFSGRFKTDQVAPCNDFIEIYYLPYKEIGIESIDIVHFEGTKPLYGEVVTDGEFLTTNNKKEISFLIDNYV